MLYKDPKLTKAVAGHAPGRRPLRGPFVITEVVETSHGKVTNRVHMKDCETGLVLRDIHGETLISLPGAVDDLEISPDLEADRRSAGQLLEAARAPAVPDANAGHRLQRRMRDVHVGRSIAYEAESKKFCRVGKVLAVGDDRSSVTIHMFQASAADRLQVVWTPAYSTLAGSDVETQVVKTIEAKRVLGVVELNKGIMNSRAANDLSRRGWRVCPASVDRGAVAVALVEAHVPAAAAPLKL